MDKRQDRRKRDYMRQDKRNPKLFKFSIGSIGTTRDVLVKEFDNTIDAKIWFEGYKKMLKRKFEEIDRGN